MQKPASPIVSGLLLFFSLVVFLPAASPAAATETNQFPTELLTFSKSKGLQAYQLAKNLKIQVPADISVFFRAAAAGDYATLSNKFEGLKPQYLASYTGTPVPWSALWQPLVEVVSGYEQFGMGGMKYQMAFGQGIIQSIPPGSIYFGGTDPGRGLVTVLCKSQVKGDPFFTLTQNALADGRYVDYLRFMYGSQIFIPTADDSKKALADYTDDVQKRLKHDQNFPAEPRQIVPGEDTQMVNGKMQFRSAISIMALSARLVKMILDNNPGHEFYIEESYPLDLIYPYLSPHDLIFKMNHQPLPCLTADMMDADHAFWSRECDSMIGGWLRPDTSLSNVCTFVKTVYLQKDWSHFTGDQEFVTNSFATRSFSKLRSSVGGLYAWRLSDTSDTGDKARLRAEADFAFREAFVLCPTSPEAIYRYINFLMANNRLDDAILLVHTARTIDPDNEQLEGVMTQLLHYRDNR